MWRYCRYLWVVCLAACNPSWDPSHTLRVGITAGPMEHVMAVAQQQALAEHHMHLELVVFKDYMLPNEALRSGQLDVNVFQTVAFLNQTLEKTQYPLRVLGKTFIYPMGLFSTRFQTLADLPQRSVVAIPNDPSNESRALKLLAHAQLIQLRDGAGAAPTLHDIVGNPKQLTIRSLAAPELPRVLPDVALCAINNDFVQLSHLRLDDALFIEDVTHAEAYTNVAVVRVDDANPLFAPLMQVLHSQAVQDATWRLFPGAQPAWSEVTADDQAEG